MGTSDTVAVSSLLRESLPANLAPFLAYTQHGLADYLEVQLRYSTSFSARQLLVVADAEDRPVGFGDFRKNSAVDGFLSYICIAPSLRGQGIASGLIEYFLAANPEVDTLGLDVFEGNVPALKLYQRLGFVAVTSQLWLSRPLPPPSSGLAVDHVQMVVAAHEVFGFSEFSLTWAGELSSFGRIGESVLRCWGVETFAHDELLAAVRATFPELSQALAVADKDASVPADSQVLAVAYRMIRTSIVATRQAEGN